jgi:hypothetical protein
LNLCSRNSTSLADLTSSIAKFIKDYQTPVQPRSVANFPDKESKVLAFKPKKQFRSGICMLLYPVKYSRVDVSNSVREFSKVTDGGAIGHWKVLLSSTKYIITIEYLALKIKPNTKGPYFVMEGSSNKEASTELEGMSDGEFGADEETRNMFLVSI